LDFSGLFWILFVCGLNLEFIQIQTQTLAFKPNPKVCCGSNYLPSPATKPAHQLHPLDSPLPLSLPGRVHTSAATYSPLHPLSSSLFPSGRSTEPHRAGARDGTTAPARRPARRGPVCARWVGIDRGGGKDPTTPHRVHPRRSRAAAPSATCPARRTARGTGGNSTQATRGLASKGCQASESQTPSHQSHWGFLLFVTFVCTGRGGEGDDAAPHQREEDLNQLGDEDPGTRSRSRGGRPPA
jgi:hypothetical protein